MISDNWGLAKDLMLSDEHIGQKVYQIEQEIVLVVKTQVVAKDDDEAFNKYLECTETRNCEGYNAPNNSLDIVSDGNDIFIYWDLNAEPNKNGNKWRHATNPINIVSEVA